MNHPPDGASRWVGRRVAAAGIDGLLGFALAVALATGPVGAFFAERAIVMLRIGSPDTVWKGPLPLVLGMFGEVFYSVPFAILVVVATEALAGRSPGKWLLGLRIVAVEGAGVEGADASVGAGRRWLRVGAKTIGCWGLVLALLAGSWLLALLSIVVGSLVTTSALVVRPPYERASRTRVVRARGASLVSGAPWNFLQLF